MSATEADNLTSFEIIDHNIAAGYVTYIVDMWQGSKTDPATAIVRYIGVWDGDVLEKNDEAIDPDFARTSMSRYGGAPKPAPMLWQVLETIREADREAQHYRSQSEGLLNKEGYRYGTEVTRAGLYQQFIAAIDVLAEDDGDEEAWTAVENWRKYQINQFER